MMREVRPDSLDCSIDFISTKSTKYLKIDSRGASIFLDINFVISPHFSR